MYIDKNYLISHTQHKYIKDLALSEDNDELINEIIALAENDIDKYTKQRFDLFENNIITLTGNGTSLLELNTKINNIEKLIINNQIIDNDIFAFERYRITLLADKFYGKVQIKGSFGWTEVPIIVKVVEKKLVEFYILSDADTQAQAAFLSAYKTQSIDGHSYTLKDDPEYKLKIKKTILSDLNSSEYRIRGRWGIEVI